MLVSIFFFCLFCKSVSCFCFVFFFVVQQPHPRYRYQPAQRLRRLPRRPQRLHRGCECPVTVLQHRRLCEAAFPDLLTGCFSAGRDAAQLPGCAEGRRLEGQRWLRKGVKEASESTKKQKQKADRSTTSGWWGKCACCFIRRSCLCPGSGPNDHVFVYFTDHGAPGILAFPNDDVSVLFLLACGV